MKEQTLKALEEAGIQDTAMLVKRRTASGTARAYFTEAGEYVDHNGEVLTISAEQAEKGAVVITAGDNIGVFTFEEAGLTAEDPNVIHGFSQHLPAFDTYADAEYIGVNDQGDIVSMDDDGQLTDTYTYTDEDEDGYEETFTGKKDEAFIIRDMVFVDADENVVVNPTGKPMLNVQQTRERLIANADKLARDPRPFLKGILKKYQAKIDAADAEYAVTGAMREAVLLNNTLNPLPDELPGEGVRLSPVHEKQTKEAFIKAHPGLSAVVEGTRDLGSSMMQGMGDAIYQRARLIYAGATQTPMQDIHMNMGHSDYDYDTGEDHSISPPEMLNLIKAAGGVEKEVSENTSVAVASLYGRAPNTGEGSVQIKQAELDGMSFMLVNDGMSGDVMYLWPTTPFLVNEADYQDELTYMAEEHNSDPEAPLPGQGFY